jgi:hypothetical protein
MGGRMRRAGSWEERWWRQREAPDRRSALSAAGRDDWPGILGDKIGMLE